MHSPDFFPFSDIKKRLRESTGNGAENVLVKPGERNGVVQGTSPAGTQGLAGRLAPVRGSSSPSVQELKKLFVNDAGKSIYSCFIKPFQVFRH